MKTLPRGATPIDFAYAVHTEVGHSCVGVRVNGAMAPLRYELRNGDICEILTRKNHLPSENWLTIARTNRARSKIRARLNAEAKLESIEIGKKLVQQEARKHGLGPRRVRAAPRLAEALKRHGAADLDDLFAAVGYGKLSANRAIRDCFPVGELPRRTVPDSEAPGRLTGAVRRIIGREPGQILVRGQDDILVHRARCCSPLPGEPIAGYITKGKGVSVHTAECPQLTGLARDPERQVSVSWKATTGTRYDADFRVRVENRKGMLADITKIIAEADTEIRTFFGSADEAERGVIHVTVAVPEREGSRRDRPPAADDPRRDRCPPRRPAPRDRGRGRRARTPEGTRPTSRAGARRSGPPVTDETRRNEHARTPAGARPAPRSGSGDGLRGFPPPARGGTTFRRKWPAAR